MKKNLFVAGLALCLVSIAMLACKRPKEILSDFGVLNNKIIESNSIADVRNDSSFQQLAQKAQEQPLQYGPKIEKVQKIRTLCKEYVDYVEGLKTEFTKEYPKKEDGNLPFEEMDKGDKVDAKWFIGDKPSKEGKEFLDKMENFVTQLRQIGGSAIAESEMKKIQKRFAAEPVKSKNTGKTLGWLEYNFKGFPLIATVTKLSQLQADIKTTESDLLQVCFSQP